MATSVSSDKSDTRIDYTTLTPRYSAVNNQSLNDGIKYLNEHGYAIFSDVLLQNEIDVSKDLLWKYFENIPGCHIRRDDPSTWSSYWPGFTSHGVINTHGIGQSDFMWNIRSNRNIKRVYSRVWNTNELLVSFDGCGVYRDWRYDSRWKTKGGWYHVDQNPIKKPDRCCVQGFVSLTNQNETTGGLIVIPYTHLRFAQIKELGRRPKDLIMIPRNHPILDRGRAIGKFIQCQAGDLVLWDSRLVHCNSPAFYVEERHKNEPVGFLRIVAYVSMSPTAFVRDYTLEKFRQERKLLVTNNCTLTHSSTDLIQTGSNANLPQISLENFDGYQRALILGTNFDE